MSDEITAEYLAGRWREHAKAYKALAPKNCCLEAAHDFNVLAAQPKYAASLASSERRPAEPRMDLIGRLRGRAFIERNSYAETDPPPEVTWADMNDIADLVIEAADALEAAAAPAPPQTQGWQPIETAPKDGKAFLALERQRVVVAVCFGEPHGSGRWLDDYSHHELSETPTHWMPLPDPPSEASRASRAARPQEP